MAVPGCALAKRLSLAVHGGKAPAAQLSAAASVTSTGPNAQLSTAASVTSTGTGDHTRFTPPLRTRLPGCHKPLFPRSGKAGCDFQPTTHAQDTAPLQQQSSRRVQEHGESKLAAVPGAPRCALG